MDIFDISEIEMNLQATSKIISKTHNIKSAINNSQTLLKSFISLGKQPRHESRNKVEAARI